MATLDRAVALVQGANLPVLIADDLDLDMTRTRRETLEEDGVVPERCGRLAPRALDRARELLGFAHQPHSLPTPARGSLHEKGVPESIGDGLHVSELPMLESRSREHRDAGALHPIARLGLRAHCRDRVGRRPDPGQSGIDDGLRKGCILGQEAVAGVNGIGAGLEGGRDHSLTSKVGLGRARPAERDGNVSLADKCGHCVRLGVDRHRGDTEPAAGTKHPTRDLAPVGHEDAPDRRCLVGGHPARRVYEAARVRLSFDDNGTRPGGRDRRNGHDHPWAGRC